MFTLGQKEVIINKKSAYPLAFYKANGSAAVAGTDAANLVTKVKIQGFGTFTVAQLSEVYMRRANAGTAKVATITAGTDVTIGTITEAASAVFQFEITSKKHEGQYIRDKQTYGKKFSVQVAIATSGSDDKIVEDLGKALKQMEEVLPFTVSQAGTVGGNNVVLTLTGKAGSKNMNWNLVGAKCNSVDDHSPLGIVTKAQITQTTAPVSPVLTGEWVEQNIANTTFNAAHPRAPKSADVVLEDALYTNISFKQAWTSDSVAAPSFVGEEDQSGKSAFSLYVNEGILADTEVAYLVEILAAVSGAVGLLATGVAAADGGDAGTTWKEEFLA